MNLSEEDKRRERERHAKKEKEYSRLQRHAMSVDDFELLTIVGRGAFGEVRIVREKSSGKLFAMKKLKKEDTVKKNQVEHVKAEREALSIVQSPFIVTLFYSFQDADYLYLVMEYLPGGDVMTLLIRKDILSEQEVRFYIAETVLALEAIHAKGYLHRCAHSSRPCCSLASHTALPACCWARMHDPHARRGRQRRARAQRHQAGQPSADARRACQAVGLWAVQGGEARGHAEHTRGRVVQRHGHLRQDRPAAHRAAWAAVAGGPAQACVLYCRHARLHCARGAPEKRVRAALPFVGA